MRVQLLLFSTLITQFIIAQDLNLAPVSHIPFRIGHRPNTPFFYYLPFTGARPLTFSFETLPDGWSIDSTGVLRGNPTSAGTIDFKLVAKNIHGTSSASFSIEVGDKLCLTPPLGWNSWNVFTTDIDENMLKQIADAMVETGMRDMGYQYINIDDFWHADSRDSVTGKPVVDPKKFPSGMKSLADYVHSKGLKLGIYSCAGSMTCGKRFGGFGFEEIDAKTYAEWGIDLLKYDYCFAPWGKNAAKKRYSAMGSALKNTNRSIVFSVCEWGLRNPWKWGSDVYGSYWRITPDIFDVWQKPSIWQYSVINILKKAERVQKYSKAGGWNDMDMLLVGNMGLGKATSANGKYKGLSNIEYQSHMSLWAFFSSPLLSSSDLRNLDEQTKAILMNTDLLSIHQDPLAAQVKVLSKKRGIRVYSKKLHDGFAIAILNNNETSINFDLSSIDELATPEVKDIFDIWTKSKLSKTQLGKIDILPHQTTVLKAKTK